MGSIVFTTRYREIAIAVAGSEAVEVPEMEGDVARALLHKSLINKQLLENSNEVSSLLEDLTYLPLAITQASAYINRNRIPIAKYLEL
jgi:hypothetical protein